MYLGDSKADRYVSAQPWSHTLLCAGLLITFYVFIFMEVCQLISLIAYREMGDLPAQRCKQVSLYKTTYYVKD